MVLSKQEFDAAKTGDVDTEQEKMASLFQLRQNTHSFLIQCSADREIQKLIYSKPNYSSPRSAYGYNCKVVHNPHAWCHLNAINSHGWNIQRHQPFDPKLKVAYVLANQNSNNKQKNKDGHSMIKNERAREQIQQFEETIRILKEENTKVKQLYLNVLKNERPQNVNPINITSNNQQINQLQQEIRTLKFDIVSHTATIQILKDRNYGLQNTVNPINITSNNQQINQLQQEIRTLKFDIVSHTATIQILKDRNYGLQNTVNDLVRKNELFLKSNASYDQIIRALQRELQTIKSNLESKIENIRILKSQNYNLQCAIRDAESSNAFLPITAPTTRDNVSQGCCTIM